MTTFASNLRHISSISHSLSLILKLEFDELARPNIFDALEPQTLERMMNGLALGIENPGLERNENARLHLKILPMGVFRLYGSPAIGQAFRISFTLSAHNCGSAGMLLSVLGRFRMIGIAIAMFIALFGFGAKYFGWEDPDGKVELACDLLYSRGDQRLSRRILKRVLRGPNSNKGSDRNQHQKHVHRHEEADRNPSAKSGLGEAGIPLILPPDCRNQAEPCKDDEDRSAQFPTHSGRTWWVRARAPTPLASAASAVPTQAA